MTTALGLALLVGCGPSLPDWAGDVPLEAFTVPEPGEIHVESPAEPVQDALIAGGWQPWPGVTDEFLVDSHVLRLERAGVWADLRTTDTGVRLLKLEAPPEARPVSAIDLATVPEPVSGDLRAKLPGLLGCQTQHGERADVVLRAGRYQWSRGRIVRNGEWALSGDTLTLDPPWAVTCTSVAGIGRGIPQLVTCGAADLLWCGGLAPGPTVALVVDDVAAARTDARIGRIAALVNRPLEDVPFPGDAMVFLTSGPASRDGRAKNAVHLRYTTNVAVPRAAARGPERSYSELAERLAYRIRRDLGVPVTVEAVDDPAALPAGIAIHAVVGVSGDVTTAER
jgi:hypothetical protein